MSQLIKGEARRAAALPAKSPIVENGVLSRGVFRYLTVAISMLVLALSLSPRPLRAAGGPAAAARQAVLVLADSWDSRRGVLRLYDKSATGWKQHGAAIRVELGKNGLGWGEGFTDQPGEGPVKREGDGKAPAGVFRLGFAFGYDPRPFAPLAVPYRQMTEFHECVDDQANPRYNTVLDSRDAPVRDWSSSETMRRKDDMYSLGLFVEYNTAPARPGAGSCIFMHVRKAPGVYTSGCTAMSPGDIRRVLSWLDASRQPVLVQLPASQRARFTRLYGTP